MKYPELERYAGVLRSMDFVNPKVISYEAYKPLKHVTIYNMNTLDMKIFSSKTNVYMVDNYVSPSKKTFKRLPTNTTRLASVQSKIFRELNFITGISAINRLPATKEVVIDYTALDSIHKYSATDKSYKERYTNLWGTVVNDIKSGRFRPNTIDVVLVKTPSKFPSIKTIKKYMSGGRIVIRDKYMFMWLEVFKLLFKEYRDSSVFSTIKDFDTNNLNFLIDCNSGYTNVRIYNILALSSDTGATSGRVASSSPVQALKKLLWYLTSVSSVEGVPLNMVGKDNTFKEDAWEGVEDRLDDESLVVDSVDIIDTTKDAVEIKEFSDREAMALSLEMYRDDGFINDGQIDNKKSYMDEVGRELKSLESDDRSVKPYKIPDGIGIVDKSMLEDTVTAYGDAYINNRYEKDKKRIFLSLAKAGFETTEHKVTDKVDIGNGLEEHVLTLKAPDGSRMTLPINIPKLVDGKVMNSGGQYKATKQKLDAVIKKISGTTVTLTSYYGKLFINRRNGRYDQSKAILKLLKSLSKDGNSKVSMVDTGENSTFDAELPYYYTIIGREINYIRVGQAFISFRYTKRKDLDKTILSSIEKHGVYCGTIGAQYLVMRKDSHILHVTSKGVIAKEAGHILAYIEIDPSKLPIEYASTKILGVSVPIVYVLSYWNGLDSVKKTLKLKYRYVDSLTEMGVDDVYVKFSNTYLTWDRNDIKTCLYLGGLKATEKFTKNVAVGTLNSKDGIKDMLSNIGNVVRIEGELRALLTLFIDPITKDTLKFMKEPTSLPKLLMRTVELLLTDNYEDPYNITKFSIKDTERINGILYKVLSSAMRAYIHASGKTRARLTVNQFEVYNMLNEDSLFALVEDMNPIEYQKQSLEVKSTGVFGRSGDSITINDRTFNISDVGVLSTDTKDDGNVGSTVFTSAVPTIHNDLGIPTETTKLTPSNVYSPALLLTTNSDEEDWKRGLYIGIQWKHVTPHKDNIVLPYRTGYEAVLPYTVGDEFCVNAKSSGKVKDYEYGVSMEVVYKNGDTKVLTLANRSTRAVGGKKYTHRRHSLLRKGDTFIEGDNLTYVQEFFGEDILHPGRVAFKSGMLGNVMLSEAENSYEDSSSISKEMETALSTKVTYELVEVIDNTTELLEYLPVGSKVYVGDNLLTKISVDENTSGLSADSIEELRDIDSTSMESNAKGEVIAIEVIYNCDKSTITGNLLKLVNSSDKRLKDKTGHTGRVKHGYNHKGRQLEEGEIIIIYNVEKDLLMGIIDKYIIGNQLKTTVDTVYDYMITTSGRPIHCEYGKRSVDARIVGAPYKQGIVNMVLEKIENDVIQMRDAWLGV